MKELFVKKSKMRQPTGVEKKYIIGGVLHRPYVRMFCAGRHRHEGFEAHRRQSDVSECGQHQVQTI